ncbi:MAG TPA: hypothetical protein VI299_01535, partial [Polyangiales bacterium]
SRVEAVPREHVLATLTRHKRWESANEYVGHLESLPLGPDVAAFLGHSDLRAAVMGLDRATDDKHSPSREELARMEQLLESALDAGFIGMSSMASRWDKLDGERFRSRPLPATFARSSELRRLAHVLRQRGGVLQSAPNLVKPWNVFAWLFMSMGALSRLPLRVSLLTAADAKALPGLTRALTALTRWFNRWFSGDVRWQHLPVPFEVYADGMDMVVFEEFGAGRAALHLKDQLERTRLLEDPAYRHRFRRDYQQKLTPRVWQRDFFDAYVVECPDRSMTGKSFGELAAARALHPVDVFLDLVVQYGSALRWRTVIANHREHVLNQLAADPSVHMGFADSGAHLRNMAFYNFPIRLLRRVQEAQRRGTPFLSTEQAIHRLSGELGQWFGLDAGTLRVNDYANIAIIDPQGLDASVDAYHEASVEEYGGLRRMVNRSDRAVLATLIGGEVVFEAGQFAPGFGKTLRSGRVLRLAR